MKCEVFFQQILRGQLLHMTEEVSFSNIRSRLGDVGLQVVEKLLTVFSKIPDISLLEETVKVYGEYFVDLLLSPRHVLRQLGMILAIQCSLLLWNGAYNTSKFIKYRFTRNGKRLKALEDQMAKAADYYMWKQLAEEEDAINGFDRWRAKDECSLYNAGVLRQRIKDLEMLMNQRKVFDTMFRLRGGLVRDQHGIQNEALYTRAKAGTKLLIERYQNTLINALNMICDENDKDEEIPLEAKLAFFNETRHAYGRTALLLSGGAALGYYHVGLAKALWEAGLLPRVISGASAGSLIAAVIGTRTDEEMMDVLVKCNFRSDFFRFSWENKRDNIARKFQYLLPQSFRWISDMVIRLIYNRDEFLKLDTEHFKEVVIANVGHYTFQEAFDRTGRIINITVAPLNPYDPPRLLNYLTAPHVCVWSAAAASCAIPGVFESIQLIVKEPNGEFRPEHIWTLQGQTEDHATSVSMVARYSDGSIENDLPMQQISELFNVNHFIVSQVNPHSSILSSLAVRTTVWSPVLFGLVAGYLRFLKAQFRDWLRNLIDLVTLRSLSPSWGARRGFVQMITQEYEGRPIDVTIQPWNGHRNPLSALFHLIENVSPSEFQEIVRVGENNTYPFLSRIQSQCGVERTLDRCVHRLRERIFKSNASVPAIAEEFAAESKPVTGRTAEQGVYKLDRTPSFYTSRSVVNLHELSVGDPLKTQVTQPASVDSVENFLPDIVGESGYAILSMPLQTNEETADALSAAGMERSRSSSRIPYLGTESVGNDAKGDAPVVDEARASGLTRAKSMADFYYKRSHSQDALHQMQF